MKIVCDNVDGEAEIFTMLFSCLLVCWSVEVADASSVSRQQHAPRVRKKVRQQISEKRVVSGDPARTQGGGTRRRRINKKMVDSHRKH
jgi:hypothetical protein